MLTGAVNSKPFDIFAPGECLFAGCDGTRRVHVPEKEEETENGDEIQEPELVWDLTFDFLGSPNVKKWIDGIGYVSKRGWDFVHITRRKVDYNVKELKIPGQPNDMDQDVTAGSDGETIFFQKFRRPGSTPLCPTLFIPSKRCRSRRKSRIRTER